MDGRDGGREGDKGREDGTGKKNKLFLAELLFLFLHSFFLFSFAFYLTFSK